jgi:amino acid adenylation domain-containing protein
VAGPRPAPVAAEPTPVVLPDRLVGLWAFDEAAEPLAPYNLSLCWRLRTGVDRGALRAAVDDLVQRHAVLSAGVRPWGGEVAFVPVAAPVLVTREVTDGQDLDTLIRTEADRRFALASQPALRVVLWEAADGAVLQLTVHHVAADGPSTDVIQRDLAALYLARAEGATAPAPVAPFMDVLRQAEERNGLNRDADEQFWTARIGGWGVRADGGQPGGAPRRSAVAGPDAPLFPRGGDAASAAASREYGVGGETSAALADAARASGVTPFTVLLGVLAIALGRRFGEDAVTLAVPIYGRATPAEEAAVGCFVNTVPVRVDLDPARPVSGWLRDLHGQVRSAVRHGALPYPRLVELCRAAGGETAVPTVMLAYQNWGRHGAEPLGLALGPLVYQRAARGHFELGFEVSDGPAGIEILAGHRVEVLPGPEVDGVVEEIRRGVAELARVAPERTLSALLDPSAGTLVGRFADAVRRQPTSPAVEDARETLSYAQLDAISEQVSEFVTAATAPGEPVAVLMGRSALLVAVLLGVLRSGRPYVPLDDSYPAERLRLIVEGAGCRVAVVDPGLVPLLPAGPRALTTDQLVAGRLGAAEPGAPRPPTGGGHPAAAGPDDLAYLMFTSGSTGRPKGVAVTHGNVVHLLDAVAGALDAQPGQRLLAVTSVCFDISVLELFGPLLTGGTVVVAERADVVDPVRLAKLVDTRDIDLMQATPSGWQLLLDGGWSGSRRLTALCGGEAMPASLAEDLAERTARLWNVYGPTETTIWSTIARIDGEGPVHLGDPLGATDLVVTEVGGRGAPGDGEPGELWIGGPGVASGYWHQPELTAGRFTAHPNVPERGGRYFRTGDLVRRDGDGRMIFLGRGDGQVKIRGHRVELGEVEHALDAHPALARTVVALRGTGMDATLVAVAVPARGAAAPDLDALRDFAVGRVPGWMLPDRLLLVDALPLTANGKVDREAAARLADPGLGRRAETAAAAQPGPDPAADLGPTVTSLWSQLLGVGDVPATRRFFDLGGTSLLLVRLLAQLTDRYPDSGLKLADLFAHPTVADQVALLASRLTPVVASHPPAPPPAAPGAATPSDRMRRRRDVRRAVHREEGRP